MFALFAGLAIGENVTFCYNVHWAKPHKPFLLYDDENRCIGPFGFQANMLGCDFITVPGHICALCNTATTSCYNVNIGHPSKSKCFNS